RTSSSRSTSSPGVRRAHRTAKPPEVGAGRSKALPSPLRAKWERTTSRNGPRRWERSSEPVSIRTRLSPPLVSRPSSTPGRSRCRSDRKKKSRTPVTGRTRKEWKPMTKFKRSGPTAKHINTRIKSDEGEPAVTEEGVFTGYASVFGNTDSYGEVVVKGAFAESLESQDAFPVYWSHQMSDPMMNIGKTLDIYEDDHGLFVKGQLDLDSPMGAQVYRLIKDGRVNQMSFAFDVEDFKQAKSSSGGDDVIEL